MSTRRNHSDPIKRNMEITITLRGALKKYLDGDNERKVIVPDGCTCDEALKVIGLDHKKVARFGFVAVNGMKVMIYDRLKEGDELKAYPRISGG